MELQRFAFSTSAFARHSLKKSLKRIAKLGFKGVEILVDKPHLWLESFSPREVDRLQKHLEKLDLFVSNINSNSTTGFWTDAPPDISFEPSLISRSKTLREWRIAYAKKALRIGKELGAHSVSITSGRTLQGVPPEKAVKYLEEGLSRLLDEAVRLQQCLSIEFTPGLYVETTAELKALLVKMNSPFLGASVDVGHADLLGEDPCHALRALKGRIFNLHLKDIRGHKPYARIPGEGDLDFRGIFRELDNLEYTGPLTWELHTCDESPDEACQRTQRYLKTLLLEMKLIDKQAAETKTPPEEGVPVKKAKTPIPR